MRALQHGQLNGAGAAPERSHSGRTLTPPPAPLTGASPARVTRPSAAMASEGTPPSKPPGDGGKDGRSAALPLNPMIPIRGIRMKFAVLAGLVDVGDVTSRDIVETVFNLVRFK